MGSVMADKLKYFFNRRLIQSIAGELRAAHPAFAQARFVTACLAGLDELELTARAGQVAEMMRRYLPQDFAAASEIIVRSLGPELGRTDDFGFAPFRYLPHVLFVGRYGLEDFDSAMQAQYQLTKRFSAEWSIRAFLSKYPEATCQRLLLWAGDTSVHVRRLVSEGTRPRLPWAPRLPAFQADPRPVLRLLERLKDDPERYVQRSVANNLNDIGKDHPDLVIEVCKRWSIDAPAGRQWIVKHALRSLVKAGHRGALAILGYAAAPKIEIVSAGFQPRRVRLGAVVRFAFELVSTARHEQELLVDFAVHFVKANGLRRPKVFKLRKVQLAPRGRIPLAGQVSFASMTTRTPQPGRHLIEVLINGVVFPLGEFDVLA